MDNGIYARVRKYATNEGTPENHYEDDGYEDFDYKPNDHCGIYKKLMEITDNDYEISCDVANWCEFATIGDIYAFREGEIEIMYID